MLNLYFQVGTKVGLFFQGALLFQRRCEPPNVVAEQGQGAECQAQTGGQTRPFGKVSIEVRVPHAQVQGENGRQGQPRLHSSTGKFI